VFCARFIASLRVLNGLVAGSLLMRWPRFFLFDLLGAACWVGLICSIGYFFGHRLFWLIHFVGRTGLICIRFTFLWTNDNRWEGQDYTITVVERTV
jgi:membrane protein DedA with SNARE-associated domain